MKVLINGYTFKVKFEDGDTPKMKPDKNSYTLGLTEYVDGVIRIRKGVNQRATRTTVIHELTHAFLFAFGYSVDGEEAMCGFFGAQGDSVIQMADSIMKEVKLK